MGKSAYKKSERLREKKAQKIGGADKQNPLKVAWYFNKWYEKIILIVMFILGTWKIIELVF